MAGYIGISVIKFRMASSEMVIMYIILVKEINLDLTY